MDVLGSFMWHIPSYDDLRRMTWFSMSNYFNFALFLVMVALAILQARAKVRAVKALPKHEALPAPDFPPVEVLPDFDWKTTEPLKLRPYKPKFHLTMDDDAALENLPPSELLLMDKNYHDRIKLRRQIIKDHYDIAIAVNDQYRIRSAVSELYTFLLGTYLPIRFPNMFKLHQTVYEQGKVFMLQNLVTNELIPAKLSKDMSIELALETLGKHLDEDFLLLLPSKDESYRLEAYVTCFPSGFNTRKKLGQKLRDIHGPVPGYKEKLEASMDRFFSKVEVGKYVKRVNWSVTMGADLYAADGGTHAHEGEEVKQADEVDIEKTFLRCERQTLHRLPKSEALVFAFKTYLYPIQEVKDEGSGEELAQAIDGLKEGSVPAMHFYKRGAVWGEAVKKYLRS